MVWILGLQRAYQQFKLRKPVQVFEAMVLLEKRPAREPGAYAALQPLESGFALASQGQNAGNLVIGVVRVSE